jgi:hypothetical protein
MSTKLLVIRWSIFLKAKMIQLVKSGFFVFFVIPQVTRALEAIIITNLLSAR